MLLTDTALYLQDNEDMPLQDIEFFRGDSFPIRLIVKQNGQPVDLTGCRVDLVVSPVKAPVNSENETFAVEALIDPDQSEKTGFLSFVPSHTQTDKEPKTYWYGAQIISTSNHVRSTQIFKWTMLQDIPKRPPAVDWDAVPDWDTVPDWDKVPGQE